jgi:hypothetical protein
VETSIEVARMSWAESESKLYAMVVSDPSCYERAILAVRAVANEMRLAESSAQLVAMWPTAVDIFVSVMAARGLSEQALPREQVLGAAFALREREIREQAQSVALRSRINAALQNGESWVVLDESGRLDAGLLDPYECTEMHLASGLAVISKVQLEPERGALLFVVSVVRLNPLSGGLLDAEPGIADWSGHVRLEDFMVHRRALRDQIASMSVSKAR